VIVTTPTSTGPGAGGAEGLDPHAKRRGEAARSARIAAWRGSKVQKRVVMGSRKA
jgi:hypothetical protein